MLVPRTHRRAESAPAPLPVRNCSRLHSSRHRQNDNCGCRSGRGSRAALGNHRRSYLITHCRRTPFPAGRASHPMWRGLCDFRLRRTDGHGWAVRRLFSKHAHTRRLGAAHESSSSGNSRVDAGVGRRVGPADRRPGRRQHHRSASESQHGHRDRTRATAGRRAGDRDTDSRVSAEERGVQEDRRYSGKRVFMSVFIE
jgi:hypothetical protein